jgi:poly-beta-1,6-N-acetyl-D-glucosamine synthase
MTGGSATDGLRYVLITAARNEAQFIERTLRSVVEQARRPLRWVIVNDGSEDATEEIVRGFAAGHPWIEIISLPPRKGRHFGGKAAAFAVGYDRVRETAFEIVGNLDADLSFERDYFAYLLERFEQDPRLGVAGTPFRERGLQYDYRFSRKEHVSGACQLFRRECYESIGGYQPRKEGGIDLVAVVTARMKGWRTETFTDKFCVHHRPMGTAGKAYLRYVFRSGYGDYVMGVHPLWQFLRSVYQMSRPPVLVSGALLLSGYLWGAITRPRRPVSAEFVRFRRDEQRAWLREHLRRIMGPGSKAHERGSERP